MEHRTDRGRKKERNIKAILTQERVRWKLDVTPLLSKSVVRILFTEKRTIIKTLDSKCLFFNF